MIKLTLIGRVNIYYQPNRRQKKGEKKEKKKEEKREKQRGMQLFLYYIYLLHSIKIIINKKPLLFLCYIILT